MASGSVRTAVRPEKAAAKNVPGFRPLYRQVYEVLVRRIAEGVWKPGDALPSEPEIAADLRVSHGTVRKALDELAAENLVLRRQGRGTYVASHDDARILFQFFKIVADTGEHRFPESRILSIDIVDADSDAAQRLAVRAGARMVRLDRVRSVGDKLSIFERILLPKVMFPGIEKRALPNNLYELYRSVFGVTIVRTTEKLKAVGAARSVAKHLEVAAGTPLLQVDRVAFGIDGKAAEWRVSLCLTDTTHYLSDLR
jgi:GntR family transcriptional regulator